MTKIGIIATAICAMFIAGCGKAENQFTPEYIEQFQSVESPELNALKQTNEDSVVALAELERLFEEAEDTDRHVEVAIELGRLAEEYRKRRDEDPAAAARWYREQLEGKSVGDFVD